MEVTLKHFKINGLNSKICYNKNMNNKLIVVLTILMMGFVCCVAIPFGVILALSILLNVPIECTFKNWCAVAFLMCIFRLVIFGKLPKDNKPPKEN